MVLQLSDLQELFGPPLNGADAAQAKPTPPAQATAAKLGVCTDSRTLRSGQVFIPLVGESFDGHAFVADAIAAGACALVLEPQRLPLQSLLQQANAAGCLLWGVDDTLDAYQRLALEARKRLQAPVVAVTGSAGKTTTRELIRGVLAPLGPVWASSGNENNDIGVPLTLLGAGPEHSAVVVEMGMRGLGEIERLSRCARPDVAVITNIGSAHIGRLGSREAIVTAKCEIVSALTPAGVVVIPAGDPLLDGALERTWSGRVLRVALNGDLLANGTRPPDLTATPEPDRLLLADGAAVPLPLPGLHNARNLLLALAVARELGVPLSALTELDVQVPGGRSRRLQLGGLTVLDETYNASPEAVLAALELLAAQPGRRFAVLGTMLELGDQSVALHGRVASRAAALGLDGLVVVAGGAEAAAMAAAAAELPQLAVVASPEQAASPLAAWLQPGDVVLLKASRGVALERLIPLLPRLSD
ncbi:MAG: UDP-N-acetylmuramoyl-tripeptide--D-alanyl-D-alanine ligase [Cyanobacteria bacterium K_DeepCast_35m_m2_023]|nr:UDP-N-acetylmuramoyl-tripeptide--D-alanyl-D-alanine ligase [Cyanobacteria bacterium K_DeepCast_35m_m2_023]